MEDEQKGRRASQIIFHIQKFKNGTECVVITFLPSKLIPVDKCITITDNFNRSIELPLPDDFTAINNFLDRLVEKDGEEIK